MVDKRLDVLQAALRNWMKLSAADKDTVLILVVSLVAGIEQVNPASDPIAAALASVLNGPANAPLTSLTPKTVAK